MEWRWIDLFGVDGIGANGPASINRSGRPAISSSHRAQA
jgi:hypothetical protein